MPTESDQQTDESVDESLTDLTQDSPVNSNLTYALPQPSLKPIAIFLTCLVLLVAGGLAFMSFTGTTVNQNAPKITLPFKSVNGSKLLQPIVQNDEPPTNIIGSLAFPPNTKILSQHVGTTNQYNANLNLKTYGVSAGKLFATLSTVLKRYKWKIITDQIQNSNDLLIASLAGNDGFFWTVGFTIPIVQNSSASVNAATIQTQFKMSLFQQSDGG